MGHEQPLRGRLVGTQHPVARRTVLCLFLHAGGRALHVLGRGCTRPVDTATLPEEHSEMGRPLPSMGRRREGLHGTQPVWCRTDYHPQDVAGRQDAARRWRHGIYRPGGRGHEVAETERLLLPDYPRRRSGWRLADGAALEACLWPIREARGAGTRLNGRERASSGGACRYARGRMVVLSLPGHTGPGACGPPATGPMEGRLAADGRGYRRQWHRRAGRRMDKAKH